MVGIIIKHHWLTKWEHVPQPPPPPPPSVFIPPVKCEATQRVAVLVHQVKRQRIDAKLKVAEVLAGKFDAKIKAAATPTLKCEVPLKIVQKAFEKQTVKLECLEIPVLIQILELTSTQLWRFHAVGDDKTCPDCASLDGKIFHIRDEDELADMFPNGEFASPTTFHPNIHPNCRCQIVRME